MSGPAIKYGGQPFQPHAVMYGGLPYPCVPSPEPWIQKPVEKPNPDGLDELLKKIVPPAAPVMTEARVREIAREEIKAALHEALRDIRAKLGALRDLLILSTGKRRKP